MTTLTITGITASHQGTEVLHGIDLTVPSATTTAVLGPSGCGKSTLLRVVAGFLRPDSGEVRLGDEVVVGPGTWVAPERRGLGYVSQEGNLFPHLDVAGNITYGMPRRGRRDRARVAELLELVGLSPDLASRRPDQLSGGQQQRIALARALARRPKVVLLDEPFSALDAELRVSTREAVAAALAHEQATVVLVTHDQAEALSFADQVAIMHEGRFSQVGAPTEVYSTPLDRRSATFLGEACFLPGRLEDGVVQCALGSLTARNPCGLAGRCEVLIRPEQVRLSAEVEPTDGATARAEVRRAAAEVTKASYFGHDALVELRLLEPGSSPAVISARTFGSNVPAVGSRVIVTVEGESQVFPSSDGEPERESAVPTAAH
ncbi:sugar ABC transporter [Intrasporangium chromatireducens Q5-1]|uniref:ABC-type quaternary amine transporter n=1 Tax=Intrasporangium chromatireducens Q5-1 TaxID=584657 RepID=W9GHZ9_9MICO|nr:ABC transporter ATP-binding protein [Intrasporangium chromatireducens]EWT04443.1 sugar ABC transporter [Intrasporangium chromatireducens Q5-1]